MINAKVKFIHNYSWEIDKNVNDFLQTIDVRQIIKIEMSTISDKNVGNQVTCLIMYLELADIRESKIESILDKKIN